MTDIFGSSDNSTTFELVPEGTHIGVIRFAVDCGHHRDSYQGKPHVKHLIYIGWELNCKDASGKPHWKGDFYTATDFIIGPNKSDGKPNPRAGEEDWFFGGTSNFNKILRAWTGLDENTVKWKSFVGKLMHDQTPCRVVIEHSEDKKDKTKFYSNIDAIKPIKSGETYKREGDVVSWTFGMDGFDALPGNLKKKINASIEMTEGGYKVPPKEDRPKTSGSFDDQDLIPF